MPSYRALNERDDEIASLEKRLSTLKRIRNAFQPICLLPTEILVQILQFVQHIGDVYDPDRPWRTYNPEWVRSMLTCHHIRRVAIASAILWTVLDFENLSVGSYDLAMTRSQNALLYIHTHSPDGLKHLERTASAHLRNFTTNDHSPVNYPAPSLRTLKLSLRGVENPSFGITSQLLGGGHVSLVSLVLQGYGITLKTTPFLPTLAYLKIESIRTSYDLLSFSGLLEHVPALRNLHISGLYLQDNHDSVDPRQVIPIPQISGALPMLKQLTLDDKLAEVSATIRILSQFAATCDANVRVTTLADSDDDGLDADEVEAAMMMNANHALIYENWLQSGPTRGKRRITGSISYDVPYDPQFGVGMRFTCEGAPAATLSIRCIITTPTPLLNNVTVLRLFWHGEQFQDSTYLNSFDTYPIWHLPNIEELMLIQFDLALIHQQAPLKAWIARQTPRLRSVQFMRCERETRPFMQELLAESLVGEVSWSDEW